MKKYFKNKTMIGKLGRAYFKKCIDIVIDENIPGDFVQCGVWRGGLAAYTLHMFSDHNLSKKIYLFDTFEGMTQPIDIDGEKAINAYNTITDFCLSGTDEVELNLKEANLDYKNYCKLIKGKVEQTLKEKNNLPESISFLHLDTDWYESTKIELETLFPLLSKNGILMIDDYKNNKNIDKGWEGCTQAVDDFFQDNKDFSIEPMDNMYHEKILIARRLK